MGIGLIVSVALFSDNPQIYTGPVSQALPQIGDVTFIVGFVLAAALYYVFNLGLRRQTTAAQPAVGSPTT